MVPPGSGRRGRGVDKRFLLIRVTHVRKLHGVDQNVPLNSEPFLQHQGDPLVTAMVLQWGNDHLDE